MDSTNTDKKSPSGQSPDGLDTFEEMEEAPRRGGLMEKFGNAFQDALQSSRGQDRYRDGARETMGRDDVSADDLAIRRARNPNLQRVYIPEGVTIYGSMTSGTDTEISGRIEGDVTVDGRLYLGPSALISGNVKATSCKVEGLIEGRAECARELELTKTGRINDACIAGKRAYLAGQVYGSVTTGGRLHLATTATLEGDVVARELCIEEEAVFNGRCSMRTRTPDSGK